MPRILLACALAALTACQSPAPQHAGTSAEKLDPFVVMIDAERWGVIIDRAIDGAREAPGPSDAHLENETYRADIALKSGAARLLVLRNDVCTKGILTGAACEIRDWPAWTREPPTDKTPIEEMDRRSQWLGEAMQPFTEAGCEAGRAASSDRQFCDVE
jgi:hypothetical protein